MQQLFFRKNYLLLLWIVALFSITCNKNPQPIERIIQNTQENIAENLAITEPFRPIILGEKLENPFSVENMKKALNELNQQTPATLADAGISQNVDMNDEDIYTTDLYVRFLPADTAQYATLQQDTTLILFNTPLDYEIKQSGDYYKDSSVSGEYTWLYTTVKPDYVAPPGIKYEVLSKLFIPEHSKYYVETPITEGSIVANTGNAKNSRKMMDPNFVNTLLIQSFVLTGNSHQLKQNTEPEKNTSIQASTEVKCRDHRFLWRRWRTCETEYKPEGTISVSTPNGIQGVKGVVVRMNRWFDIYEVRTNANGRYDCPFKFNKNVLWNNPYYTIVFNGYTNGINWSLDRSLLGAVCLWTSTYNAGKHSPSEFSMTFYDNSGSWGRCILNNAIYDYVTSNVYRYGLTMPISPLKIATQQVQNIGDESASTPLFSNRMTAGGFSLPLLITFPGFMIAWGFPDMILRYSSHNDTAQYNGTYSTTWHELTHASQVRRLEMEKGTRWAAEYWSTNAKKQLNNTIFKGGNPYGNKGDNNWQQTALSEGWGYFMEWTMAGDILRWNSIAAVLFKDNSFRPLQYQYSSGDKNMFFSNIYAGMFDELNLIGCNYHNMEQSLATYNLAGYRDKLIRYYPNLINQITEIIDKYENFRF